MFGEVATVVVPHGYDRAVPCLGVAAVAVGIASWAGDDVVSEDGGLAQSSVHADRTRSASTTASTAPG